MLNQNLEMAECHAGRIRYPMTDAGIVLPRECFLQIMRESGSMLLAMKQSSIGVMMFGCMVLSSLCSARSSHMANVYKGT